MQSRNRYMSVLVLDVSIFRLIVGMTKSCWWAHYASSEHRIVMTFDA